MTTRKQDAAASAAEKTTNQDARAEFHQQLGSFAEGINSRAAVTSDTAAALAELQVFAAETRTPQTEDEATELQADRPAAKAHEAFIRAVDHFVGMHTATIDTPISSGHVIKTPAIAAPEYRLMIAAEAESVLEALESFEKILAARVSRIAEGRANYLRTMREMISYPELAAIADAFIVTLKEIGPSNQTASLANAFDTTAASRKLTIRAPQQPHQVDQFTAALAAAKAAGPLAPQPLQAAPARINPDQAEIDRRKAMVAREYGIGAPRRDTPAAEASDVHGGKSAAEIFEEIDRKNAVDARAVRTGGFAEVVPGGTDAA